MSTFCKNGGASLPPRVLPQPGADNSEEAMGDEPNASGSEDDLRPALYLGVPTPLPRGLADEIDAHARGGLHGWQE